MILASASFAGDTAMPPKPKPHARPAVIEIVAEAESRSAPDIATINAGVVSTAETAAAAMSDNRTKMNAVFEALKAAGIEGKDMQSAGISISPQYRYEQNQAPVVTGYQASNSVNVIVRDLAGLGGVIDALVAQGMNQLNGPNFDVENKDEALDRARADAVKKARARAELYASAAGVTLGPLVKISEQVSVNQPPYPMMRMAAASAEAASTPVAPGEVALGVTVNVTYAVAP
jgi:uncharacterized protein YggE